MLAEISVNGDASSIVIRGQGCRPDKTILAKAPEVSLYCFHFLKEHAPEVLKKYVEGNDRGALELHLRTFPFNEITAGAGVNPVKEL